MAVLIQEINNHLPLQSVLAIFASQNDAYVELMEVSRDGKFLPGVPLSTDALENLYQFLYRHKTGSKCLSGAVPPEMLYMNSDLNYYVFCAPPAVRDLFLTPKLRARYKQRTMKYPGIVFRINGEEVDVFIHEGEVPSFSKPLYPAPFFNIDSEGNLCKGNATMDYVNKATTFYEFIEAWQNVLFRSKYSHGNDGSESHTDNFMTQCIVKKSFNWAAFKKKFSHNKIKLEQLFI